MADYYTLIARAATRADTDETRRSMYDRARAAQLAQLRKLEPPLSEAEIERERSLLEEAIRRVERETAGALPVEAHENQPSKGASLSGRPSCPTIAPEVKNTHEPRASGRGQMMDSNSKDAVPTNGFDLLSNPFILLRVTPYSTAQEIKHGYEDALEEGIASADVLQRAQQSLLTPKLRIDAEVGGFLDVRPEVASHVIGKLEAGVCREELDEVLSSLHALPKSNVLAFFGSKSPLTVAELIQLLEAQAIIAVGSVYDAVIEGREQAGAGKITREVIEEALGRLEERQVSGVVNALSGEKTFAGTFCAFVKRVLTEGQSALITKLDPYIRAYSRAAAPELSRRRENVISSCDVLRENPKNEDAVDQIVRALREWNEIEEPIQLFESHMHREDTLARELYLHVRELCIWLANKKEQFDIARKITQACAEIFKELPRAVGQMKEESELLTQLHNQQTAATLLEPLIKAYEEAQQKHRALERELLRNGFGPASTGIAKRLYETFADAVRKTTATEIADFPWRLVRGVAISLNNESQAPKAAVALINGLVNFFSTHRPSAEIVELLQNDRQACTKNTIQADLERSLSAGHLGTATTLVDQLAALEKDSDGTATLQKVKAAIAGRRRSRTIKVAFWSSAAVILLLIVSYQDNRPSYSSPSTPRASEANEDQPPVGMGLTLSRANIRYCEFQRIRLEALRPLAESGLGLISFNNHVDDWNSRCSRYRYRPSDKSAVDAELDSRRAALEAQGRALAY
jgi:hypothetical protein